MNEATRMANMGIENRGYLVFGSMSGLRVGSILPFLYFSQWDEMVDGPLRVMATATVEEMRQQLREYGLEPSSDGPDGRWEFFKAVAE